MGTQEPGILAVVDVDNLLSNVEGLEAERCPSWLMEQICRLGTVIYAFALVDFRTQSPALDRALMLNGYFPVQCPKTIVAATGRQKDSVDGMAIELVHSVLSETPRITTVVFVSGDRDFVPMLAKWKVRGKEIVVMAKNGLSREMSEVATRVIRLTNPVVSRAISVLPPSPIQLASLTFIKLLRTATSPDDFRQVSGPDLQRVRDSIAHYFRTVVAEYVRAGKSGYLTKTFLTRGLTGQRGPVQYLDTDARRLVYAMIGTVLATVLNASGNPCHPPNYEHPFMRYVAEEATAA